ncbi:MAG: hypothetical protein JXA42_20550 [Anaerolineales bacterium]|nr:hypothetical protein [Anaerolineales bacterium]
MAFCTAINCMDGRVQLPVIEYLQKRFNAEYVDVITEMGPNQILAYQIEPNLIESILKRLEISVSHHHSVGIAIVAHDLCAGNPAPKEVQFDHLKDASAFLGRHYKNIEIIKLWVDSDWRVYEIP